MLPGNYIATDSTFLVSRCCILAKGQILTSFDKLKHQLQRNFRTRDTLEPMVLSFVERSSLSQRVPYRRFHCNFAKYSVLHSSTTLQPLHTVRLVQTVRFMSTFA